MKILGIETSCDETALSIIDAQGDQNSPSFRVEKTALHSQIDIHKEYGGVFPSEAKRAHAQNITPLLIELFSENYSEENNFKISDEIVTQIKKILEREEGLSEKVLDFLQKTKKPENIDMIAVTFGPGLEPTLWVGINVAKALSLAWSIPVLPTNHMEGHIASVLAKADGDEYKIDINFPALALLISGGHTELIEITHWGKYQKIGQTKDDALGEAYDKVARMLDLPYPGGPQISKLASQIREKGGEDIFKFPRPMINSGDFNFSLSGLKTAVLYKVQELTKEKPIDDETRAQIAFSFEEAVTEVIIKKTHDALEQTGAKSLIVGGGVIANEHLRKNLYDLGESHSIDVFTPEKNLATDNAVMIAMAAYIRSFDQKAEINPEIIARGSLTLS